MKTPIPGWLIILVSVCYLVAYAIGFYQGQQYENLRIKKALMDIYLQLEEQQDQLRNQPEENPRRPG